MPAAAGIPGCCHDIPVPFRRPGSVNNHILALVSSSSCIVVTVCHRRASESGGQGPLAAALLSDTARTEDQIGIKRADPQTPCFSQTATSDNSCVMSEMARLRRVHSRGARLQYVVTNVSFSHVCRGRKEYLTRAARPQARPYMAADYRKWKAGWHKPLGHPSRIAQQSIKENHLKLLIVSCMSLKLADFSSSARALI